MTALILFGATLVAITIALVLWRLILLALLCLTAWWVFGQTVGIVVTTLIAACLIGEG